MKTNLPTIKVTSTRVNVLGVGINAINMPNAVATIERWIKKGKRHYVCVSGVHGVMECQKDENLRHIHNASGLTVPDGVPLVGLVDYKVLPTWLAFMGQT